MGTVRQWKLSRDAEDYGLCRSKWSSATGMIERLDVVLVIPRENLTLELVACICAWYGDGLVSHLPLHGSNPETEAKGETVRE